MTEALQKRNVKFITTIISLVIIVLLTCSESKKVRKQIIQIGNRARYQTRSAYCFGMQPNQGIDDTAPMRFHQETQRCYRVGERGPCGEMMVFTSADANFGECDCDQSLRCGRPLIYWPAANRCFYAYDQGPCREDKWLVFGFDLHPVCRRNPCLKQEQQLPSHDNRYWFNYKGQCYRTYTQGYCKDDEILFNMKTHFRPICVRNPECVIGPINKVQSLTCLPGQKMDFYGQCKREFKPLKEISNDTDLAIRVTQRPTNLYCLYCKT